MGQNLIRLDNIAKAYTKGKTVLAPLELSIDENEIFFLLGPSGCGKSTLLRILAGLLPPDQGQIFLRDREITKLAPEKREMAMVFQNYALWPHMSVAENIAFGLKIAKKPKAEIVEKVTNLLKIVELTGFENRAIGSLSGGQQQRVALARALAVDPKLLLLDEPLSNLDAKLRDTMRMEIRTILKAKKLSAVYVTHDRQEALTIADRMAVMRDGQIEQIGTPGELYRTPCNRFVASFLGSANFLAGVVEQSNADSLLIRGQDGTMLAGAPQNRPVQSRISLLVRPENLRIGREAVANGFQVTLLERIFMGEKCEYHLQSPFGPLIAAESPSRELPPGDYYASIKPEHLIALDDGE